MCMKRIEYRSRQGEEKITKEYLALLKSQHDQYFNECNCRFKFKIDYKSFLNKSGILLLNFIDLLAKNDVKNYFKMEFISNF